LQTFEASLPVSSRFWKTRAVGGAE
jgi:hypothetical protein